MWYLPVSSLHRFNELVTFRSGLGYFLLSCLIPLPQQVRVFPDPIYQRYRFISHRRVPTVSACLEFRRRPSKFEQQSWITTFDIWLIDCCNADKYLFRQSIFLFGKLGHRLWNFETLAPKYSSFKLKSAKWCSYVAIKPLSQMRHGRQATQVGNLPMSFCVTQPCVRFSRYLSCRCAHTFYQTSVWWDTRGMPHLGLWALDLSLWGDVGRSPLTVTVTLTPAFLCPLLRTGHVHPNVWVWRRRSSVFEEEEGWNVWWICW